MLQAPLNGTRLGNGTRFPNIVTFFCDEGFDLRGSKVRRCKADGFWSGVEVFCEGERELLLTKYTYLVTKGLSHLRVYVVPPRKSIYLYLATVLK